MKPKRMTSKKSFFFSIRIKILFISSDSKQSLTICTAVVAISDLAINSVINQVPILSLPSSP